MDADFGPSENAKKKLGNFLSVVGLIFIRWKHVLLLFEAKIPSQSKCGR